MFTYNKNIKKWPMEVCISFVFVCFFVECCTAAIVLVKLLVLVNKQFPSLVSVFCGLQSVIKCFPLLHCIQVSTYHICLSFMLLMTIFTNCALVNQKKKGGGGIVYLF